MEQSPQLTDKELQKLNSKALVSSGNIYANSEIGDINYIDTPDMLDLSTSNALAQIQSSSVPNLNAKESPTRKKHADGGGISSYYGDQIKGNNGISSNHKEKKWRAYQKLIQYYNQRVIVQDGSQNALAIGLNRTSINQESEAQLQLPHILQLDTEPDPTKNSRAQQQILQLNPNNSLKPQDKLPSEKLDRTLKVYLGLKEKRELKNMRSNPDTSTPHVFNLKEKTPPVNLTQDMIELSSRPSTKLTMETNEKKGEIKKRRKVANTHRIKIIDGELPNINQKIEQSILQNQIQTQLSTELLRQDQFDQKTASNAKRQLQGSNIRRSSLINNDDGSTSKNRYSKNKNEKLQQDNSQIVKIEILGVKNRSRVFNQQNSNTIISTSSKKVHFNQLNEFIGEQITLRDLHHQNHNRTTQNAVIEAYKDAANTPQIMGGPAQIMRIKNQTQRSSIEYADGIDFKLPVHEHESQSLRRARRSFEKNVFTTEDSTPSLSGIGAAITQGGAIGLCPTDRYSIIKPQNNLQDDLKLKNSAQKSSKPLNYPEIQQSPPPTMIYKRGPLMISQQNQQSPLDKRERYKKVMNFNEEVMACEFEKAERMLKRAEKLIKKAKLQAFAAGIPGGRLAAIALGIIEDDSGNYNKKNGQSYKKQEVKFCLPSI